MKMGSLSAGDICSRVVVVAERGTPLCAAARRMREQHVGCLVVVDARDAGRQVVGMLTDRDIVTAVVAEEMDPRTLRVEDVMTGEVVTVPETVPFADLLATMRRKGLRRLPVIDARGLLVGVVTLDDLLEVVAGQMRTIVQAIESGQRREREVRR